MNSRLLEIQNRIDAIMSAMGEFCAELLVLRAEQQERREGKSRSGDVPLVFESDGRTIRWDGGSVRLGKKPYKFVKSLYGAKKRRMGIARIAKAVWGNELTSHNTIKVTACNLGKELKKAKFPFKIASKTSKEKAVEYKDPRTGEPREIIVQSEIIGFSIQR